MKVKVYNSKRDKMHASVYILPALEFEKCMGLRFINVFFLNWKIVFFLQPES